MFKKNITLSVVAMATLFIVGCGGNSATKKDAPAILQKGESVVLPKVSDELRRLVQSSKSYEGKMEKLPTPTQVDGQLPLATEIKNCTNGGTMNFTNDFNLIAVMQSPNDYNMTMISKAVDCVESGMTLNGEIETFVHIVNEKSTMRMTYLTDLNIADGATEYVIKKGSFVVSEDVDDFSSIDTETMEIISDGKSINV